MSVFHPPPISLSQCARKGARLPNTYGVSSILLSLSKFTYLSSKSSRSFSTTLLPLSLPLSHLPSLPPSLPLSLPPSLPPPSLPLSLPPSFPPSLLPPSLPPLPPSLPPSLTSLSLSPLSPHSRCALTISSSVMRTSLP